MDIKFYNRVTGKVENEKVYGSEMIEWLYQSKTGQYLSYFLCKAPFSYLYGKFQDTDLSKNKIEKFIKDYQINMDDFEVENTNKLEVPYKNFNNFFIRKFKKGKRDFVKDVNLMGAFAEARYYGYQAIDNHQNYPVKGEFLSPEKLVANEKWFSTFKDGPLLLARLCPVDYHRYHFPDNGKVVDSYFVPGWYHSVNPLAIKAKNDILITNERMVTIIQTENFGKLAYIEVGAICVGKIVQSFSGNQFYKGDEKGYFLFGGSTVIVVGEKGKWIPSRDILENTEKGLETYTHLGTEVAIKL